MITSSIQIMEDSKKTYIDNPNKPNLPFENTKIKISKFVRSEKGEFTAKILDAGRPGVYSLYKCFFKEGLSRKQKFAHGIWGLTQLTVPVGSKGLKYGSKVLPKYFSNAEKARKFLTNAQKTTDKTYEYFKKINNYRRYIDLGIDNFLKENEKKIEDEL